MKTAMLTVKIDPQTKNAAQKVADDLGFSLSAIVNASLKNLVRSKTVSYSLLEPSPFLKKAIIESRKTHLQGKDIGPFTNATDFMKSLRS